MASGWKEVVYSDMALGGWAGSRIWTVREVLPLPRLLWPTCLFMAVGMQLVRTEDGPLLQSGSSPTK